MSKPDDWKIDVKPEEKVPIPSFIRLFVFNRILRPYINDKTTTEITSDDVVRSMLVTVLKNKKEQQTAFAILSQLFKNGLQKFMNELFDISVHPNVIEKMHNQLILTKFSQEYANVTKYKTNDGDNDTSCQSLVFNANDLMCCVLQFLSYKVKLADKDNDLLHCSLVNSHWLYHVFNPNSCYQIDFTMLWNEKKGEAVINKIQARLWQRVIKVKSVNYHTPRRSTLSNDDKSHDKLLSKLSMLNNVEKVAYRAAPENVIVLKALIQQCRKNIKHFDVAIGSRRTRAYENVLSPLTLPNAQEISVRDKYFNIIWTNKCTKLEWFMLTQISKDWCNFVINNCDCSGVKHLIIDDVSFNVNVNVNVDLRSNSNKNTNGNINGNEISLLSSLAQKFVSIEKLDIILVSTDYATELGLLWQGFASVIEKNNTYVTFTIRKSRSPIQKQLLTFIDKNNIRINQIVSRLYTDEMNESLCVIVEKCQHLESINIIGSTKFIKKLEKISLGSSNDIMNENDDDDQTVNSIANYGLTELKRIELIDSLEPASIDILTDLLSLKFLVERKIFLMAVINIEILKVFDESAFLLKFQHFCQKIYTLLFKNHDQLVMNIEIKFGTLVAFDDKCIAKMKQIFKSIFDENMVLSQFKLSKHQCNKYCTNMEVPVISFAHNDADSMQLEFCAANACAIEK